MVGLNDLETSFPNETIPWFWRLKQHLQVVCPTSICPCKLRCKTTQAAFHFCTFRLYDHMIKRIQALDIKRKPQDSGFLQFFWLEDLYLILYHTLPSSLSQMSARLPDNHSSQTHLGPLPSFGIHCLKGLQGMLVWKGAPFEAYRWV